MERNITLKKKIKLERKIMTQFTSERLQPDFNKNKSDFILEAYHKYSYYSLKDEIFGKVLDYGCGEGYGSEILARFADEVNGADISSEAIDEAKKNIHSNLTFTLLKDNYLPFDDNTFDFVTSFQVIEHVEDVDLYLREIKRVLKRGGKYFLTTPNARTRLFEFQKPWNLHHYREYSEYQLKYKLSHFFKVEYIKGISLKAKYIKKEVKRVFWRKLILYPISFLLVPEKIRKMILKILWDRSMSGRTKSEVYEKKEICKSECYDISLTREKEREKWMSFIVKCKKID